MLAMVMCGDKLVSSAKDESIRVWNTKTWVCERVLEEHHADSVFYKHDGQLLISGGADSAMRVWRHW